MVTARLCLGALALSCVAGCAEPLLVPDAGPNAPGFVARSAPPPPDVVVATGAPAGAAAFAGALDGVKVDGLDVVLTGWARLAEAAPRGTIIVSLPGAVTGEVRKVTVVPRPDVVAATADKGLTFAGFEIAIRVARRIAPAACVSSTSAAGSFHLAGSDGALCRTARG